MRLVVEAPTPQGSVARRRGSPSGQIQHDLDEVSPQRCTLSFGSTRLRLANSKCSSQKITLARCFVIP